MDYLGFLVSEQLDYFQHSAYPYLRKMQDFARSAIQYISGRVPEQCNYLWINIKTNIHWHWIWSKEHWNLLRQSHIQFPNVDFSAAKEFTAFINVSIRQNLDRTHIVMCVSGLLIGIIIGMKISSHSKAQMVMRAVVCSSYNGPESVSLVEDIPVPRTCGPYEVMIEVKAASIDHMDVQITLGYGKAIREQYHRYKGHKKNLFPFPLGRECSGRVVEIGSKVQEIDVGDEVYAAVPYYACGVASEVALVPSEWVAKKPSKLTFEAAAALPYSASLAWNAIVLQASLNRENTPGKRVLIHAVQNPVGCIAAQLIKAWGGHVTATVSKRGLPIAQRIGVDDVILYDSRSPDEDFNLVLATRNKFDVVLNTVGSFLHDSCKKLCAEGGVVVSTVSTPPASDHYGIFFGSLYSWMLRIMLLFQRGPICSGTTVSRSVLNEISSLVNAGHLQPIIDRIYDANQSEQAAQLAAKGHLIGKIIIRFR